MEWCVTMYVKEIVIALNLDNFSDDYIYLRAGVETGLTVGLNEVKHQN